MLSFVAFLGATTIMLGAFGAHALKKIVNETQLNSFETGVKYQMYHVILLIIVNTYSNFSTKIKLQLSYLFIAGIVFFSGSIYAITFGVEAKNIWFVTPLGGILLILGWCYLAISFLKIKQLK